MHNLNGIESISMSLAMKLVSLSLSLKKRNTFTCARDVSTWLRIDEKRKKNFSSKRESEKTGKREMERDPERKMMNCYTVGDACALFVPKETI